MDAYKLFYEKYKDKLFAYLMRMTGDYHLSTDTMQEGFMRSMERYGSQPPSVPLIYTMVRRILIDKVRAQARITSLKEDLKDELANPEDTLLVREEYRRVLVALQNLEEHERDILTLAIGGDLCYRDIAAIMDISEANVKVRIHRARLKLKKILGSRGV